MQATAAHPRDAWPHGPVLLYDGTCGFCTASVRFILAHERQRSLSFASLQGALASTIRSEHPWLNEVDSIVWVEPTADGRRLVYVRSLAALRVARYLGGLWRFLAIAYLVPRAARDRAYDAIARRRRRLLPDVCELPTASNRRRFLD